MINDIRNMSIMLIDKKRTDSMGYEELHNLIITSIV